MPQTPFAVLIPTRNRCETLRSTLLTCTQQNYERLTIIVSDNVSDDQTRDIVDSVQDPRIRYIRPERRLSMSGNFEFSLGHVDKGYLMHLGDDDALIADSLSYVDEIIRETGTQAVTSSHALYHWPTSLFEDRRNRLVIAKRNGFSRRSTMKAAQQVIDFRRGYPILPGTYSSFVDKAVIDRASRSGKYYHSITPDSYSCFVNAAAIDTYIYSFRPFSISGISSKSNGASQFTGTDKQESENYLRENDIDVHPDTIYCQRSVELIVLEAFLQARDHQPRLEELNLDYRRIAALALRNATGGWYPEIREAIRLLNERRNIGVPTPLAKTWVMRLEGMIDRLHVIAWRLSQGYRRVDLGARGINNIADASRWAAELFR